jgi:hypothetical protein
MAKQLMFFHCAEPSSSSPLGIFHKHTVLLLANIIRLEFPDMMKVVAPLGMPIIFSIGCPVLVS